MKFDLKLRITKNKFPNFQIIYSMGDRERYAGEANGDIEIMQG